MSKQYKIFYGILDWGLGHASRSIPIIRYLLKKGNEVHIGSSGRALELLSKEIHPDKNIQFFRLPDYSPEYKGKTGLLGDMLRQTPHFLDTIQQEEKWLRLKQHNENYDLVISDNRFGLHCDNTKNIFLSHQATILTPGKFGLLQYFVNQWYQKKYLKHFDEIWIPDSKDKCNLSGKLSLGKLPLKMRYIGPLSRFWNIEQDKKTRKKYDLLLLLSGPEPQRTYFEEKLLNEIRDKGYTALCVQGKTEIYSKAPFTDSIQRVSYLNGDELLNAILSSDKIICRAGYSTIMELAGLGKQAILIPTPGQSEQEYLAKILKDKGWFFSVNQNEFELETALEQLEAYKIPFNIPVNFFYKKIGSVFKRL